ncbi:MAG: S8 family serine peptidase [Phycisphaerales bacterium]|nr:S8 family serine peptidase [Phycisphaerales bacterium]
MNSNRLSLAAAAACALSASVSLAGVLGPVTGPLADPFVIPDKHPTRVLVRFATSTDRSESARAEIFARTGVKRSIQEIDLVPGLRIVEAGEGRVDQVVAALRREPGVLYANPDYPIQACAQVVPFGITAIKAPQVWSRWGNGGDVIIGHLDTGIDLTHPDLPTPLMTESFVPGLTVDDYDFHGTHTASVLVGLDNDIGVIGITPSARILVAKVLNNWEFGFNSYAIAGINWSVANGARVLNMALGNTTFDQAYKDTCDAALASGVLLVASAGNTGNANPFYPAWFPSVMAVSAVEQNDDFMSWTSFGPNISIAAPGAQVYAAMPIVGWKVTWNGVERLANQIRGGTVDPYTGTTWYCNTGEFPSDFPSGVVNNIAHLRRSTTLTLGQQVQKAVTAGAKAVIISNNEPGNFVLNFTPHLRLPVCSISQADGDALQADDGVVSTIGQYTAGHTYGEVWGTSVSCPHVAGAAALLIGNFQPASGLPALPPLTTRWVLERTARQVGPAPRNDFYGYGIVDAENASKYLHGRIRCPGDLNADDLVDDTDFVDFAGFYNDLLTPGGAYTGGDFNGDGLTDDSDFVVFAGMYDQLLCT